MKLNKWQKRHFSRARNVAEWSKDDSTKVGCVAVADGKYHIMDGYNSLPEYLDDDDQQFWKRPDKYDFVEHAERNMLYKMARFNIKPDNFDVFMLWFPCPDCMRALEAHGCKKIYCDLKTHSLSKSEEYIRKFRNSFTIAVKSGIKVYYTLDGENLDVMNHDILEKLLNKQI